MMSAPAVNSIDTAFAAAAAKSQSLNLTIRISILDLKAIKSPARSAKGGRSASMLPNLREQIISVPKEQRRLSQLQAPHGAAAQAHLAKIHGQKRQYPIQLHLKTLLWTETLQLQQKQTVPVTCLVFYFANPFALAPFRSSRQF